MLFLGGEYCPLFEGENFIRYTFWPKCSLIKSAPEVSFKAVFRAYLKSSRLANIGT
jgi:hypothetical protein